MSPKVRKFEGSWVRRFFSPKVRKLEIKGPAVRTNRFWNPKVQYSEILKYVIQLFHNPSKLVEYTHVWKQYSRDKSAYVDLH